MVRARRRKGIAPMSARQPTLDPNELDTLPTLRGPDAVVAYCASIGIPISRHRVRTAIWNGELHERMRMSNFRCFARREVREWLAGGGAA